MGSVLWQSSAQNLSAQNANSHERSALQPISLGKNRKVSSIICAELGGGLGNLSIQMRVEANESSKNLFESVAVAKQNQQ